VQYYSHAGGELLAVKNDNSLYLLSGRNKLQSQKLASDVNAIYLGAYPAADIPGRQGFLILKNDKTLWAQGYKNIIVNEGTSEAGIAGEYLAEPELFLSNVVAVYNHDGTWHDTTFAITTAGELYAWGGSNGIIDTSTGIGEKMYYTPVKLLDNIAQISCPPHGLISNGTVAYALKRDGTLYRFGTVDSQYVSYNKPTLVLDSVTTVVADDGSGTVAAIKADRTLWVWGTYDESSVSGIRTDTYSETDTPFLLAADVISCGWKWVAGESNFYYIKSDNTYMALKAPSKLQEPQFIADFKNVRQGGGGCPGNEWTSIGWLITNDDKLYVWNDNAPGYSLGNVPHVPSATPALLMENVSWFSGYGVLQIIQKTNGELWGYGNGVLGSGEDWTEKPKKMTDGVKLPNTSAAPAPALSASPSKTAFMMNGESVSVPEAYNVEDNNYLQLRGIAMLLNGTAAQFNVTWDGTYAVIETRKPYTGTANPATLALTTNVRKSNTQFKIDGKVVSFDKAYYIDGDTNYLQLREFAEKLNGTSSRFNVYWDSEQSKAVIEPGKPYTGVK
jgi:hypothetical protein